MKLPCKRTADVFPRRINFHVLRSCYVVICFFPRLFPAFLDLCLVTVRIPSHCDLILLCPLVSGVSSDCVHLCPFKQSGHLLEENDPLTAKYLKLDAAYIVNLHVSLLFAHFLIRLPLNWHNIFAKQPVPTVAVKMGPPE